MAHACPLLLLLFTSCAGALAQGALTQPPSVTTSPGETVRISCTRSSGSITSDYVSWYQQKPGSVPKLMLYEYSKRPTGIPDRFTGSTDSSANSAVFTISNVQAEDEADYYCFSYVGNGQRIFGGGTQLTVSGGPQSPPTVNLYCPSKEEMASKRTATIPCMVNDYNPSPATAIWEVGGTAVSNGVQTTKPVKDNGKYMFSSYLTVTDSEWERDIPHTCKVRHEEQDYMKSVSQSQCP